MKRIIIFGAIAVAFVAVLIMFAKVNAKSPVTYESERGSYNTIVRKTVATGTIIPLEQIDIKPQISGIISEVVKEEGDKVKRGDLIAKVRVVPNVQNLSNAMARADAAQLQFDNQKTVFNRNKDLYERGVISRQEYDTQALNFENSQVELRNAKSDLQIIKKGTAQGLEGLANTNITAQISGTILAIPIKIGNQVIETNSFNAGSTIATIADLNKMIFEGRVDESEVGSLKDGTELEVSIGAIPDKKFPAKLNFVSPRGSREGGAVQFIIKADMVLDKDYFVRAGYSANADIILAKRDNVFSIREALLQFDPKTDQPYVEVKIGNQKFQRRDVQLGLSDGIYIEILSGITPDDEIKIWNRISKGKGDKGKFGMEDRKKDVESDKRTRDTSEGESYSEDSGEEGYENSGDSSGGGDSSEGGSDSSGGSYGY